MRLQCQLASHSQLPPASPFQPQHGAGGLRAIQLLARAELDEAPAQVRDVRAEGVVRVRRGHRQRQALEGREYRRGGQRGLGLVVREAQLRDRRGVLVQVQLRARVDIAALGGHQRQAVRESRRDPRRRRRGSPRARAGGRAVQRQRVAADIESRRRRGAGAQVRAAAGAAVGIARHRPVTAPQRVLLEDRGREQQRAARSVVARELAPRVARSPRCVLPYCVPSCTPS